MFDLNTGSNQSRLVNRRVRELKYETRSHLSCSCIRNLRRKLTSETYVMMDLTKIPYCIDCGSSERAVYWGGGPRCQKCSDKFSEEVRIKRELQFKQERAAYDAHIYHAKHEGECPDDGVVCKSCCEHEFDDSEGGYCLNCEAHATD